MIPKCFHLVNQSFKMLSCINNNDTKLFQVVVVKPPLYRIIAFSPDTSVFSKIPINCFFTTSYPLLCCSPQSATCSPDGKFVLICDPVNHCILKLSMLSSDTVSVSLFSGKFMKRGDCNGTLDTSRYNTPTNLAFSPDGTYILVCDYDNFCIRKICVKTGKVSTFAGMTFKVLILNGSIQEASFSQPTNIVFSPDGTYVLVCESMSQCIRRICLITDKVSTFAGNMYMKGYENGSIQTAKFTNPNHLTFSPDGKNLFLTNNSCVIRKICISSREVSTFAGIPHPDYETRNGPKEQAKFVDITHLSFSLDGKMLIVCDRDEIKCIKIKK